MEKDVKTIREIVIEKYGSISAFFDIKLKEHLGDLPISRPYFYKLINHEITNPGIKTLNLLADITGMPREELYKEYSE